MKQNWSRRELEAFGEPLGDNVTQRKLGGGYICGGGGKGGGGGGLWRDPSGTGKNGGSGVVILKFVNTKTITIGAGLTGTTAADGSDTVATITAGTGNVSWA